MPIAWTGRPEADRLLEQEPLALLIGLLLDQQVPMERAFGAPYELKRRLGHLDASRIASAPPEDLEEAFRRRPALHRFPVAMARRARVLCEVVASRYGGDAGAIWREAGSGEELFRRISALPGFGEQKARITVAVLGKRLGVRPPGWERHAADWHTIADVDSPESMALAREAKRRMKAGPGA
ncbi:MAG TPA: HhH-GPD-type base excision DNA repair protein [Candidatus Dormibacteraeota bacterium]|nr:HhH-GPD-type base excision DNA repair protein [Candidatus Dormibacteraeota bacterium]